MAKEAVVYQANPLIEGRRDFSLIETRLFYIGLRGLQGLQKLTKDTDKFWNKNYRDEFPVTIIPSSELVAMFGNRKYYSTLEDVCKKMAQKTVEVKNTDTGEFDIFPLFSRLSYKRNSGLTLEFNKYMRQWLLDLTNSTFTKLPFDQVWALNSPYSVRLLELLIQYQNTKTHERTLTVEEIRTCLNVPSDTYQDRMDAFKRRIVDFPVKDINAKTAYKVEYEPVKNGRRIVAFKFKLHLPLEAKRRERLETIAKMPDILPSMPKEGAANTASKYESNRENAKGQDVKPRREMPSELKAGFTQLKDILGM